MQAYKQPVIVTLLLVRPQIVKHDANIILLHPGISGAILGHAAGVRLSTLTVQIVLA